jgi:hypothetical protein
MLRLEAAVVNGIISTTFQPYFTCPQPATDCTWDDFTTLGVCRDFRDMSGKVWFNCTGSVNTELACEYFLDESNDGFTLSATYSLASGTTPSATTTLSNSSAWAGNWDLEFAVLRAPNLARGEGKKGWPRDQPPETTIYYNKFYWCEKTYHNVTATPSRTVFTSSTSKLLEFEERIEVGSEVYMVVGSNSTKNKYRIKNPPAHPLWLQMRTLLHGRGVRHLRRPDSASYSKDLDISDFIRLTDLDIMAESIAATITNQIRSRDPGDNANSTTVQGQAFYDELFYYVRWPWITLNLVLVALVAVLLVITIIQTRSEPLLKSSLTALLFYGLEGWSEDEISSLLPPKASAEGFESGSENFIVTLVEKPNSRLVFLKAD